MKAIWCLLLASSFFFVACKKTDTPKPPTPTASKQDLIKDSVYLYTKEVYLWQDVIPSYDQFNPRKYSGSTDLEIAQNVMNGIRSLQPLDRFSMVLSREASSGLQTGEDTDFGFFVSAGNVNGTVNWYVSYVYDESTAGKAGVQRGWYINKINGSTIRYDQPSVNILNNIFFGSATSASFEFVKADGTPTTFTLNKTSFVSNSVLYKNVLDAGGKKVGYFVFNQFFGAPSRKELAQVFNSFQSQGISELIVDLRYNPGGSVETQDTLSNLIAPTAANGRVMYQYIFNSTLQQNKHQLIRKKMGYGDWFAPGDNTVSFQKAGNLNLSRVFFIVGSGTASASELLINNLKPYMDVKILGDTTYGKPVGFFPIPVYEFDIYPISFKTVNSAGNADYYNGFAPDKLVADGVNRNWGDINEPSLAAALKYISTGSWGRFTAAEENRVKANEELQPLMRKVSENKFSGMFIEKK